MFLPFLGACVDPADGGRGGTAELGAGDNQEDMA